MFDHCASSQDLFTFYKDDSDKWLLILICQFGPSGLGSNQGFLLCFPNGERISSSVTSWFHLGCVNCLRCLSSFEYHFSKKKKERPEQQGVKKPTEQQQTLSTPKLYQSSKVKQNYKISR